MEPVSQTFPQSLGVVSDAASGSNGLRSENRNMSRRGGKGSPVRLPNRRKTCIVKLDGFRYTIVASSPERSADERKNSLQPTDGPITRTGSVTVLRRTLSGGVGSSCGRRSTTVTAQRTSRSGTECFHGSGDDPVFPEPDNTTTGNTLDLEADKMTDPFEASQICSVRLKNLLGKLQNEEPGKEYLVRNLEYVIRILDVVFLDETKSVCDDEDELNKVETEAVPTEVRDWLAMTFTRPTTVTTKRQANENKPKFRSVANAIRAGILVDRLYRRLSAPASGLHIPANVVPLLKNIEDWSFDVFALNEAADGHALKYVGYELLQRYDLINKFKINIHVLDSFLVRLEQGYSKYNNPYHNLVHAADVTQTMHHVISRTGLSVWLTDLEILSAIVSALIHDFEHTGTTNTFHINTSSDVALLYNDKAVLENHHVSSAFRVMKEDDFNIVSGLKTEEYREFRSLVIEIVLATDMSYHFQQIKNMRNHLSMPETIDKTKALSLMIHCADISHPAKDWNLHHRWTELLIEEFFRQGDREEILGLPISPLCDRKNTLVAQSQIGFIDFIVHPSLDVMGDMVEKILSTFQQQNSVAEQPPAAPEKSSETVAAAATNCSGDVRAPGSYPNSKSNALKSQRSICSQGAIKFEVRRYWDACLTQNKSRWKERAAKGWVSPLQETNKTSADNGKTSVHVTTDQSLRSLEDQSDSGVESPGLKEAPKIT